MSMYTNNTYLKCVYVLLLAAFITKIGNYQMRIADSCITADNHLYFKWQLKEYNQVMMFWEYIKIAINDEMIIEIDNSNIKIWQTECAITLTMIDIYSYWITDINKNCITALVEIELLDYTYKETKITFQISEQKECAKNLYTESINQKCLDLPHTLKLGEYIQRDITCNKYQQKVLSVNDILYELEKDKITKIANFSLACSLSKFTIENAAVENSNLQFSIFGRYYDNLTLDYYFGIVWMQNILPIKVLMIQQYTLPSVHGLIKFLNSDDFEKYLVEIFSLEFTVDKIARTILKSVYCVKENKILHVFAYITEIEKKRIIIVHPKLCCRHNIIFVFKILYENKKTFNDYMFFLQCIKSGSDYFIRHVVIKIDSKIKQYFSEIQISTKRVENIKSIRINITDDTNDLKSVLCDILITTCSTTWFKVLEDHVIIGYIPKTHFYQTLTIEGSYDYVHFYKYKYELYIPHHNKSDVIKVKEDIIGMMVIMNTFTIEWSFHKYKNVVKNFEVSISWNHDYWIKVGKCENNFKCTIFTVMYVKSLEFNKIKLNFNKKITRPSGIVMLSFKIKFHQRYNISDISVRIIKKYYVFETPKAKIYLKYFDGRQLYAVIVKDRLIQYVASIILVMNDISCFLYENRNKTCILHKTFITSRNNAMIKLLKFKKERLEYLETISVKYNVIKSYLKAEYTEKHRVFDSYDICRSE